MPTLNLQMTSDSENYDVPAPRTCRDHEASPPVEQSPEPPVTRDRSSLKKWLEPKHRRENGDGDDIMSIVSTGDERVPPDDPHDETFTPRAVKKRSRVNTIQKNRDGSPPLAKGRARARSNKKSSAPHAGDRKKNAQNDENNAGPTSTPVARPLITNALLKIRPTVRSRRGPSSGVVLSSDDDAPSPTTVSRRHPAPFPMSRRASDSSAIVFEEHSPAPEGVIDMEVFDLDAIEDDAQDDAHAHGPDDDYDMEEHPRHQGSDYDYADSFINDNSDLSEHSDEEHMEASPPPPAQRRIVSESDKAVGEMRDSDDETVVRYTQHVRSLVHDRRAARPLDSPKGDASARESSAFAGSPGVPTPRSSGKPHARMTTGSGAPKRLTPTDSIPSPRERGSIVVAGRHAIQKTSHLDTAPRERKTGTPTSPAREASLQSLDRTNTRARSPPPPIKRRYARMTTGGKAPKHLLPCETSARAQDAVKSPVHSQELSTVQRRRPDQKTVEVLEITDSDCTDTGSVFRWRSDLSIHPVRATLGTRDRKGDIGPASRLRDGPREDTLAISSDDNTYLPSTPKKTSTPRYVPDVDETPTRPSSRVPSARVPSRTITKQTPSPGTQVKTPESASADPKTPIEGKKRKRSSKDYVLSPWEYGEMMRAIKVSRRDAEERQSRAALARQESADDAQHDSSHIAATVDGADVERLATEATGLRAANDRKGKRKASRSPTPPPASVPGFEDISPEELAEVLRALRESKAAAAAAAASQGHVSSSDAGPSTSRTVAGPQPSPSAHTSPQPSGSTVVPAATAAPHQPFLDALRNDTATTRRCARLPSVDCTYDASLHDVLLADTYANRPNLQKGAAVPWSNLPGRGHPLLSGFRTVLPKMSERVAYQATMFDQVGDIRNPAWASPLDVVLQSVPGSGERFHFFCDTTPPVPLLAVSCGWLERSQLRVPATTGLRQRYLTLNIQSGEWERTLGFISTASGYPELYAQLARDCLQFSSRAQGGHTSPGASSSSNVHAPASMFKQSTATGNSRVAADSFSLPNNVTIPVYDARGHASIDFQAVLPNLNSTFPEFTEEIPHGSFVMVGYTLAVYTANSGNRTLGCNIQWAIVFGCPSD